MYIKKIIKNIDILPKFTKNVMVKKQVKYLDIYRPDDSVFFQEPMRFQEEPMSFLMYTSVFHVHTLTYLIKKALYFDPKNGHKIKKLKLKS